MKKNDFFNTKDIVIMGVLIAILFVQEQVLAFIPNVQLTVLLIVLYTKVLGWKKTVVIVAVHVLLDNLYMGSLNIYVVPAMLVGWLIIPFTLGTFLKRVNKPLFLALLSIVYVVIYDLCFAISNYLLLDMPIIAYLAAGIVFQLILAASSFISILWLYEPLKKVLDRIQNKEHLGEEDGRI